MTDTFTHHPAAPDRRLAVMHASVDIGFAVLLVVCAVRYFNYHPFNAYGMVVLALAATSGLAYAVSAIRPLHNMRQSVGILLATALWLPLAVMAPSLGWCAFALFFAVHRILRTTPATVVSGFIVVAVSAGLFIMSNGEDLGLVLGPFFGGIVLTFAYGALDRALESRRRLINELIDTRAQLAESERESGRMAERERLASELHDTVVQRTASALLLLESDQVITTPALGTNSSAVGAARETLREALAETRQLMHGLAAGGRSAAPFADVIGKLAREHGAEFSVTGTPMEPGEDAAYALLRMTQEALTNVGKHASATTVRVTLTYFDDEIGVDVADNGVGFDLKDAAKHESQAGGYGLRAMAWRIESLSGSFSIESTPGRGTVVAGLLPIGVAGVTDTEPAGQDERPTRNVRS